MVYAKTKTALLALAFALTCAAAAGAQTAGGMDAMQYFAGNWTCSAGPSEDPSRYKLALAFAMDSGIMREWDTVEIPGQSAPYTISKSISYDADNKRWVQTLLDAHGQWRVSYLNPWTGSREEWLDQYASAATLGRDETERIDAQNFAFRRYASSTDMKPVLEGRCTRSE
jgi:hypothetical protein